MHGPEDPIWTGVPEHKRDQHQERGNPAKINGENFSDGMGGEPILVGCPTRRRLRRTGIESTPQMTGHAVTEMQPSVAKMRNGERSWWLLFHYKPASGGR